MKKLVCFSLLLFSVPIVALVCNSLGFLSKKKAPEQIDAEDEEIVNKEEGKKRNETLIAWRKQQTEEDRKLFQEFMKNRREKQKKGVENMTIEEAKEMLRQAKEAKKNQEINKEG